jgi:hypothetical protein
MLTYGIFNPRAGIFVSGILFFNGEYCKIIFSLIGVLFGIILMLCPYLLGLGLYLVKIIKNILNFFLVKIIAIYFGILGIIFSLIFSILQNDLNKNKSQKRKEIFDIKCEICSYSYEKKSNFGIKTIIKMIFNLVIPGSGIFSLLCKFGCHIVIFFIGLFQMISGLLLVLFIIHLVKVNNGEVQENEESKFFYSGIFLFSLTHFTAGTIIIFISDYFEKIKKNLMVFLFFH